MFVTVFAGCGGDAIGPGFHGKCVLDWALIKVNDDRLDKRQDGTVKGNKVCIFQPSGLFVLYLTSESLRPLEYSDFQPQLSLPRHTINLIEEILHNQSSIY